MSTINLVEKIERKRKGVPEGALSIKDRIQMLSSEGSVLSEREKILVLVTLVCIGAVFGARYYVSEYMIKGQTEELVAKEQKADDELLAAATKLKSFENIKSEIDSFEKKVGDIKAKIAIIDQVQKGRSSIVRMIDFVINEMPPGVWLTKVTVSRDTSSSTPAAPAASATTPATPPAPVAANAAPPGAKGKIEILGYALSLQLVSDFVDKLKDTVFFPNWQLVETSENMPTPLASGPAAANTSANGVPPDAKKFEINAQVVAQ